MDDGTDLQSDSMQPAQVTVTVTVNEASTCAAHSSGEGCWDI